VLITSPRRKGKLFSIGEREREEKTRLPECVTLEVAPLSDYLI